MVGIENLFLTIVLTILIGVITESIIKNKQKENQNDDEEKECKYCKMKMNATASVCPTCRKSQSNANNPLLLIPICGILLLGFWFLFSNNAPDSIREVVCSLGIRKGEYCLIKTGKYEIEVELDQR